MLPHLTDCQADEPDMGLTKLAVERLSTGQSMPGQDHRQNTTETTWLKTGQSVVFPSATILSLTPSRQQTDFSAMDQPRWTPFCRFLPRLAQMPAPVGTLIRPVWRSAMPQRSQIFPIFVHLCDRDRGVGRFRRRSFSWAKLLSKFRRKIFHGLCRW